MLLGRENKWFGKTLVMGERVKVKMFKTLVIEELGLCFSLTGRYKNCVVRVFTLNPGALGLIPR